MYRLQWDMTLDGVAYKAGECVDLPSDQGAAWAAYGAVTVCEAECACGVEQPAEQDEPSADAEPEAA